MKNPLQVVPTPEDKIMALEMTEDYYAEREVPIHPGLVELRKLLTQPTK